MQENNSEFNEFDNEPTTDLKVEKTTEVKADIKEENEEIIPFQKRHILTLILAAVIIFIFGGILGYSFGKNTAKNEILNQKFNELEISSKQNIPKKLNVVDETEKKKPVVKIKEPEKKSTPPVKVKPPVKKVIPKEKVIKKSVVPKDENIPPESPFIEEQKNRYLQIASFQSEKQAVEAKKKYKKLGYVPIAVKKIEIKDKGTWYRVIIGPITLSNAKNLKTEFKKKFNISTIIK
ncbi:SPOR domain-containing protein [Candidatus Dependentiae bacterium]|nr:SPOR domain-containing protein [Candidatus Dependentiae bacterium]